MKITKALITAAGPNQRKLPLQTLIDRDRKQRTVLEILIKEIKNAGIDDIGIVIQPEDEKSYAEVLDSGLHSSIQFIHQNNRPGYGNALLSAEIFLNNEPFLHLVGDHLYVNKSGQNVAKKLVDAAEKHKCSISTVQSTRENNIGNYGTVKAERLQGEPGLFQITRVHEKPTPTFAEQHLMVPGLRAGYYLCFYGMHVFTPLLLELLNKQAVDFPDKNWASANRWMNFQKEANILLWKK
jgi:UTP--glucose-1-phosphate uridylyltransferase